MPRIFISHSQKDTDLAAALKKLLIASLRLPTKTIYNSAIYWGTPNESAIQLKEDLVHADVLLILITKNSIHSDWIIFELGAFLDESRPTLLISGPGITKDNIPMPFSEMEIKAYDEHDFQQIMRNTILAVAKSLNLGEPHEDHQAQLEFQEAIISKSKSSLGDIWRPTRRKYMLIAILALPVLLWAYGLRKPQYIQVITQKLTVSSTSAAPLKSFCLDDLTEKNKISCGGVDLLAYNENISQEEKDGRKAFKLGKFIEAEQKLRLALMKDKTNPSIKLAYNNAEVLSRLQTHPKTKVFTVGMTLPVKYTKKFISKGLLSGAVERQKVYNQNKYGYRLFIVIADDENQPDQSALIAKKLGKYEFVLALIGPYSSESTISQMKELDGKKLLLISASSTATLASYKARLGKNFGFNWFFRTVSTTEYGAKQLVSQISLSNPLNNKLLLFYQGGKKDLFVTSFLEDFRSTLLASNLDVETIGFRDKNNSFVINKAKGSNAMEMGINLSQVKNDDEIVSIIQKFKDKQLGSKKPGELVIAIIPNAFRDGNDLENGTPRVYKILKENEIGEFLIFGANTLYEPRIFDEVIKTSPIIGKRLIVNIPWYPYDDWLPSEFRNQQDQMAWQFGPTYDAISVLVQGIERLVDQEKVVDRLSLQEAISEEIHANEFNGVGKSTFRLKLFGRSAQDEQSHLVSPMCTPEDKCFWRLIKSSPSKAAPSSSKF